MKAPRAAVDVAARRVAGSMPAAGSHGMGYVASLALTAALGGFLFGFDSGVINGAVGALEKQFGTGAAATGLAVSAVLLGCAVAALVAGSLADRLGRRPVMIATSLLFVLSALGCGFSHTAGAFIVYRVIGGLGIGAASVISPAYISEVAPARARGRLGSLQQLAIVFGLFFAFLSNYMIQQRAHGSDQPWLLGYAAWRWMFWVGVVPAVMFLLGVLAIPESPRYLVAAGRLAEARKVFSRVSERDPDEEVELVRLSLRDRARPRLADVLVEGTRRVHPAVWIGAALAAFQQLVGINTIFYYGEVLWRHAGFSQDRALFTNLLSGGVNIASTLVAIALIDRVGRKPLLLAGSVGMALSLGALAAVFLIVGGGKSGAVDMTKGQALGAIVAAHLYIVFFAVSWGPLVWVMLPELMSNRMRGAGMGVATGVHWLTNFTVTLTFPILAARVGLGGAYSLYALAAALSFLFVRAYIRETRGQELESI